jgi:hypothetical protein
MKYTWMALDITGPHPWATPFIEVGAQRACEVRPVAPSGGRSPPVAAWDAHPAPRRPATAVTRAMCTRIDLDVTFMVRAPARSLRAVAPDSNGGARSSPRSSAQMRRARRTDRPTAALPRQTN